MTVSSLELLHSARTEDIFGSPSSFRSDGIHLRGRLGTSTYSQAIVSAARAAGISAGRPARQPVLPAPFPRGGNPAAGVMWITSPEIGNLTRVRR